MDAVNAKREPAPFRNTPALYARLRAAVARVVVGQDAVVEQMLIALLAEGHVLIVGVPGLAKTLLVSTMARILGLEFRRIQFTPDLMPSDITGATIVVEDQATRQRAFRFLPGPLFANIVLADEINRTPPKTQAALMEAMEERQVTQGGRRLALPRPFFVLATQNPIEQEGTYPLPVSQLDRFLFAIMIDYPSRDEEYAIMNRTTSDAPAPDLAPVAAEDLRAAIAHARGVAVPDELAARVTALVRATRPQEPEASERVRDAVAWGGGPRAAQAVLVAAKARAALHGRDCAQFEDAAAVYLPALRHRLVMTYHARAEGFAPDALLETVLAAGGLRREAEPAT
ncbi:MAG TPA: MoxR family ATPase [Planctomycetota bacterium]|jgi:MoxR-like ATPase|nr:MoxR family ATPase [Planctomycetota bacterium]OQC22161.1 MAG: ATPase RavA [Planctomycetes bacterium ADurb.Bin069]HNR99725.1 MoxR family ATPase [Planctomycetota bacterium]HNU25344.1 MoxR family ATPase [Planctomycetota bacterium]HOE29387.1 MoxR family ATPase [Planctomycetota bacterium]